MAFEGVDHGRTLLGAPPGPRPRPGFFVSADSKGDSGDEAVPEKSRTEKTFGLKDVPPPVFCERVRKRLTAKGLDKHSFLKSVEEYESRGVNFVRLVAKSEKSEGAEIKVDGRKKRAKHRGTEFTEEGKRDGVGLAAIPSFLRVNMRNDTTKVTDCQ